MVRNVIAVI